MQRAFDEGIGRLHWEAPIDPAAEAASAQKVFLANFNIDSNKPFREACHNYFCNGSLTNYSSCSKGGVDYNTSSYFKRVRQHMFNVAPKGAGLDSYRC